MNYSLNYFPSIKGKNIINFIKANVKLTDEEIEKIHDLSKNYEFSKGVTGSKIIGDYTDSYETNNRDIAYFPLDDNTAWLYEKLFDLALIANAAYFNFEVNVVTDPIHYVIYPEDGGHLTWHYDLGEGFSSNRKLAMTVQLSDPSEYEGGDLQIWTGRDEPITLPREKGDIVVFPTFLLHRVTPITKGARKCLVFWSGGTPFK